MLETNNSDLNFVLATTKELSSRGGLPIIIFDLDSTLFSTAPRNLRIVREFASDFAHEYPHVFGITSKLSLADFWSSWNYKDVLIKRGMDENDPVFDVMDEHWEADFFTDDYVALDLPTPGAPEFVRACHGAGALIYYLTGRHVSRKAIAVTEHATQGEENPPVTARAENPRSKVYMVNPGMEFGTARALTERKFPFWQGRCELHLKPDAEMRDEEFKAAAISAIRSLNGTVVASFDNEPANCRIFKREFPNARNFWLRTVWDPKDEAIKEDEGMIAIEDFV